MKLHELTSFKKNKKRVGRGGKRGTTAGRGTKGQKSRSGHVIRPAERDLILKLPKRRGFRNKPKTDKPCVFNVGELSAALKARSTDGGVRITSELLKEAGLVGRMFCGDVKILSEGEAAFAMIVSREITVSKGARAKIEKAGGSVEQ